MKRRYKTEWRVVRRWYNEEWRYKIELVQFDDQEQTIRIVRQDLDAYTTIQELKHNTELHLAAFNELVIEVVPEHLQEAKGK